MHEWIDITRPLVNGIVQWPGEPPFAWRRIQEIASGDPVNLSEISTCVHVGTHIDAPMHFVDGGGDVAEISLERLCGPACVVHITEDRDVEPGDLETAGVRRGDRVLLRTANEKRWASGRFEEDYTAISSDAAQWMVDGEVPLVGIDYLSIDRYHSEDHATHGILLGNAVAVVEGLDLSGVGPGRYELIALPLKISGCDGSPVRAIIRSLQEP